MEEKPKADQREPELKAEEGPKDQSMLRHHSRQPNPNWDKPNPDTPRQHHLPRRPLNLELTPQMVPMNPNIHDPILPPRDRFYHNEDYHREKWDNQVQGHLANAAKFKNGSQYDPSIDPPSRARNEPLQSNQSRRPYTKDLKLEGTFKKEFEEDEMLRQQERHQRLPNRKSWRNIQDRSNHLDLPPRDHVDSLRDVEFGTNISESDRVRYVSHWFQLKYEARLAQRKFEEYNELIGHLFGFPQIKESEMLKRNYSIRDLENLGYSLYSLISFFD